PVREPEDQQILDGLLAEEVIDPQHLVLAERARQARVELAGRLAVDAERLLDNQATVALRLVREARGAEGLAGLREPGGRQGEVEEGVPRHEVAQRREALGLEVPGPVAEALREAIPHGGVEALRELLEVHPDVLAELRLVPRLERVAHDA